MMAPERYYLEAVFRCSFSGDISRMHWGYTDSDEDIKGLFKVIRIQAQRYGCPLDPYTGERILSRALYRMEVSDVRAQRLWDEVRMEELEVKKQKWKEFFGGDK